MLVSQFADFRCTGHTLERHIVTASKRNIAMMLPSKYVRNLLAGVIDSGTDAVSVIEGDW